MQVTRNRKNIVLLGCVLALGICFYSPMVEMPREEMVSFLEPRIEFLKSVRFTIFDHSLDLVLDWLKTKA
ncbi:MAG: hypothetical protein R8G66_15735 [Cytophagales bacterium]|nr:hypothetical protein [Cytophagales bacterium]